MAFRASSIIKSKALSEIKESAVRASALAAQQRNTMAAGNVTAQSILNLLQQIKILLDRWTVLAATPGLAAYAADQENDVNYDVAAEYTAMRTALTAVLDRIVLELPVASAPPGVAGNLAVHQLVSGVLNTISFTPAQTANLRADLDAFITAVE